MDTVSERVTSNLNILALIYKLLIMNHGKSGRCLTVFGERFRQCFLEQVATTCRASQTNFHAR